MSVFNGAAWKAVRKELQGLGMTSKKDLARVRQNLKGLDFDPDEGESLGGYIQSLGNTFSNGDRRAIANQLSSLQGNRVFEGTSFASLDTRAIGEEVATSARQVRSPSSSINAGSSYHGAKEAPATFTNEERAEYLRKHRINQSQASMAHVSADGRTSRERRDAAREVFGDENQEVISRFDSSLPQTAESNQVRRTKIGGQVGTEKSSLATKDYARTVGVGGMDKAERLTTADDARAFFRDYEPPQVETGAGANPAPIPKAPKQQTGLQKQATGETQVAQKAPHSTPTSNQAAAGATGSTSSSGVGSTAPTPSPKSSGPDVQLRMLRAKAKAMRKQGKAGAYAADRTEKEFDELSDLLNNGQHQEVADALGLSGKYGKEDATELQNKLYEHSLRRLADGPGVMDYMGAHKVMSTGVGLAVAGGTLAAINSDGGRRSNADLYSSPF